MGCERLEESWTTTPWKSRLPTICGNSLESRRKSTISVLPETSGPSVGYAVNLSVDEVLTNTISQGYQDDEPHRIELIVCMEAETLVVVIVDDSNAFDVSRAPSSDFASSIEEMNLDELGLFLVHQMMDGVEYQRLGGCNVVTLTKNTTGSEA